MKHESGYGDNISANVKSPEGMAGNVFMKGIWSVICRDRSGNIKWQDEWGNLVVDEGLNHALDVSLSAGTQVTAWYVGLTDSAPTVAAGDTMASHAGWAEVTAYSETARVAWIDGGVSGKSVDNSASKATFSINATATIGGAFLASNSTKGGTTGILYAAGAFSAGDKMLNNGDSLEVTATFTAAAV